MENADAWLYCRVHGDITPIYVFFVGAGMLMVHFTRLPARGDGHSRYNTSDADDLLTAAPPLRRTNEKDDKIPTCCATNGTQNITFDMILPRKYLFTLSYLFIMPFRLDMR